MSCARDESQRSAASSMCEAICEARTWRFSGSPSYGPVEAWFTVEVRGTCLSINKRLRFKLVGHEFW